MFIFPPQLSFSPSHCICMSTGMLMYVRVCGDGEGEREDLGFYLPRKYNVIKFSLVMTLGF